MGKVYMCGSFKGGVGKTVTTFNLAYSFAAMGKKVLAVDFDSQANLSTCFGMENAAKLAGLKEIPAIVKEGLSEAEAYVYVIETNLMQRSFTDLQISEKAAVLAERYDKVMSQGKRNDILAELAQLEGKDADATCGHSDHKLIKARDNVGGEYGLSGSSVARLLRVNQLIPEIKTLLDAGEMQLLAAVQLSYLPETGQ